ncbi:MAG: NAD-dependent epimerase/dehydratase family protein [Methermicoccaceae archaeon]
MKILVTGGAGYVGSVLVPELLKRGYEVRVLDNLMYRQTSLLPYFIEDNFEFIKGDVRDAETVKRAVDGVDMIIHLAAVVGAPACKRDRRAAEAINYQGTVNVDNARDDSQQLIYASTGSVYGALKEICTEDSPTNPLSTYGRTKLQAERHVMQSGNAIAFRFATGFGLSSRLRLDLLPNDFVLNALKNRYLVIYDKDFKRTFIHVRDIVRSYLFAIEHFDRLKDEVYNVGSEKMNYTKQEIAEAIRQKIDFEIYYADKGIPDPDQRNYEVSYQKIRNKGFETKISLDEGIEELIEGLQMLSIENPYSNVSER